MVILNLSCNSAFALSWTSPLFPLTYLKPLSTSLRFSWPFSPSNHSLCSLSFATSHLSIPPCWSLLSPSLFSHLWQSQWGDRSLAGPGCFIEQRLLIFLFIERPGRQRTCQPVPIAPHLSSCLGSYSQLVSERTSNNPLCTVTDPAHINCACADT